MINISKQVPNWLAPFLYVGLIAVTWLAYTIAAEVIGL